MKFLPLIWRNLGRKKVRTAFTVLSIFIAFVLFGLLAALKTAFSLGVDLVGIDRLLMLHKVSLIQMLPLSYQQRIAADQGVEDVTHATWFGGYYQDVKNQFPQFPVDPEAYLRLYPEFVLPEEQKQAWFANRTGAVVGRATAERFGFEVGDRIPLQATIWQLPGNAPWEFTIEGIYDGARKGTDTTQFLFHYDYWAESMKSMGVDGQVGWYVIRVHDPEASAATAERLDKLFANSPAETKTATEKAFVQSFANQLGNIGAIVSGILAVVFFTLLLVAGNTVAQSVRERINELAVLKTLGFGDRLVMVLVLAESMVLAVLGGGIGLGLIYAVTQLYNLGGVYLPALYMTPAAIVQGIVLVIALGLVAGVLPALRAMRLNIVDALRRT